MEKRTMNYLDEYKELSKRYDELIKSGAGYDEARIIGIRMSAIELQAKMEQAEQEGKMEGLKEIAAKGIENPVEFLFLAAKAQREAYNKGYKEGFEKGHAQGVKDCQPIMYPEPEEEIHT